MLSTNNGYTLWEVAEQVGRPLSYDESTRIREFIKKGFTLRQMVNEVKRMHYIEIGNRRREEYIRKLRKHDLCPLSGSEMERFKVEADKVDEVYVPWEKRGYPAAYRSGVVEEANAKKKTTRKITKKNQDLMKEYREKQAKAIKKAKESKQVLVDSMLQVD